MIERESFWSKCRVVYMYISIFGYICNNNKNKIIKPDSRVLAFTHHYLDVDVFVCIPIMLNVWKRDKKGNENSRYTNTSSNRKLFLLAWLKQKISRQKRFLYLNLKLFPSRTTNQDEAFFEGI